MLGKILDSCKGKDNLTHTSFIGGKYSVIYNEFSNFYINYYKEVIVDKSLKTFLVERVQEKFKLFLDIESKDILITDETIKEIIECYILYDDSCKDYCVSKRKNRYHVHFFNKIVNSIEAMEFYDKCIGTPNKFGDIFDLSVYRSGLRMLGSCKDKNNTSTNDYYRIYDLDLQEFKDSITYIEFCNTSILFGIPDNISQNPGVSKETQLVLHKDIEEDSLVFQNLKTLNPNAFETDSILLSVKNTEFNGNIVKFLTSTSKYCPFIDRQHIRDSNPVYICLTPTNAYIKCHDIDCKKQKYRLETGEKSKINISECFPITHYSVASTIFNKYKDRFRIDSIRCKNWYEFNGIRWSPSNIIDVLISTEIVELYLSYIQIINSTIEDKDDATAKIKLIYTLVINLQTVGYKSALLHQLSILFNNYDPDFFDRLDTNPNLMGFNNGVYDFSKQLFRKTKANDYISFTTELDYIPIDNLDTTEMYEFLDKIISNKDIQLFLLKVLAKAISCTRDEKMYFWTGMQGSNGKSTLITLLEMAFGNYTMPIETSVLTTAKRGNPGAPSPHLIVLKGRRLITMQEPDNDDSINVGVMKQYSGNDTITARDLHKPTIRFKLQAKMIMCSNFPPIIDSQDGGTKRRIVYIEFTNKFCENPKKPNEFKIDSNIHETLKRLAPIFSSLIIDIYSLYLREGMETPKEVSLVTDQFNAENDKYGSFLDDFSVDKSNFISIIDLYSKFSIKWTEDLPNMKVPNIREFKKALQMRFGRERLNKKTPGYMIKDNSKFEEDIEDF